jgi:hypothetical protein
VSVDLFVNGTLMRGLALHANLDGAEFLEACQTAERYRLYSIGEVHPGMFEVTHGGVSVRGELDDGRVVQGILFPRHLAEGIHRDITAYGGWREYIASSDGTRQRPGTTL